MGLLGKNEGRKTRKEKKGLPSLLLVSEGELVPNGTFLIYGRGGKSTSFRQLLIDERQRTKSDLDVMCAILNIMRRRDKTRP
jgi:hypothetical protein